MRPIANAELVWTCAYLLIAGAVTATLFGGPQNIPAGIDALFDSKGYLQTGQALLDGTEPPSGRVSQRGYAFPMLSVAISRFGPFALFFVQLIAVAFGFRALMRAERKLCGRLIVTPLAILSVSLLVAPAFRMTEALSFAAAAVGVQLLVCHPSRLGGPLGVLFAALIRPAFIPAAILAALIGLRSPVRAVVFAGILTVLVTPQLILSKAHDGNPALSTAGASNFSGRFYPAVYGIAEFDRLVYYRDAEAAEALDAAATIDQQLAYVLGHPAAAAEAWGKILWDHHLMQSSGYTQRDNDAADPAMRDRLNELSARLNILFVVLLLPAVWGIARFLSFARSAAWPAAAIGPTILITAPLVYWQGDRVVFSGLLLMLPFAGLGLQRMVATLRLRRSN